MGGGGGGGLYSNQIEINMFCLSMLINCSQLDPKYVFKM